MSVYTENSVVTREMVKEFLLEWLISYGTEPTEHHYVLYHGPTKSMCIEHGYLERNPDTSRRRFLYKLSDKALQLLEEEIT